MERIKILLIFGGESSEHDVSIASAKNVAKAIDSQKYELLFCYIDPSGKWWSLENFEQYSASKTQQLLPRAGSGEFIVYPANTIVKPAVILPILHGKNGEDGSVQGLAELLHIPIVGCGVEASALAMDKAMTKEIAEAHDIFTTPYVVHRMSEALPDFNHLTATLGTPLFVKPSRSGSSVGVSRAQTSEEFEAAVREAGRHDTIILIEKGITGRELEIAVIGTPPNHRTSDVGEIIPDAEFYSFDAKYAPESQTKTVVTAELDDATRQKIRQTAAKLYEVLGCAGLSRVDFLLSHDGTLYCNEINTLPGFTTISMYPKLWEAQGLSYSQLIDELITDARTRATMNA